MSYLSENVRYLCWRTGETPAEWPRLVRGWIGLTPEQAQAVLDGERKLSADELKALSHEVGLDESVFVGRFAEQVSILAENLAHLFNRAPRGAKTETARRLGVNKNTLSRWCHGLQEPSDGRMEQIKALFGLPADIDLKRDPLFLSQRPVGTKARKDWLKSRIDAMDARALGALWPALERLFR